MCRKMTHLVAIVLAFTLFSSIYRGVGNQIVNGEFNAGLEPWRKCYGIGFDMEVVQGEGLSGINALKIDVFNVDAQDSITVSQEGIVLEHSGVYPIGFTAKAQAYRQMLVLLAQNQNILWSELVDLTTSAQTFTFEYTHTGESKTEGDVILSFILKHRQLTINNENKNIDVFIDRVYLGEQSPDLNLAHNPWPSDGAIHDATWVCLSWLPGDYAVSHDVYIGKNFDNVNNATNDTFWGNYKDPFVVIGFPEFVYRPDILKPGATIYWRIDEVNDLHPDSPWKGDVWSFTIMPYTAYDPNPPDESKLVDLNVTLSWKAGFAVLTHTVYFGENFEDVNNASGGQQQYTTTYTPGTLESGKTYYWRVDEYDAIYTHKGEVWSFTTKSPDPNLAYDPDPPDGAIHYDLWALLKWSPGRHAASHDLYIGKNYDDVLNGTNETYDTFWGNQDDLFQVIGFPDFTGRFLDLMNPGVTIYWRVDEVNDLHPDSPWKGDIWSFWIPCETAYNPNPPDGAEFVETNITLSWTAGFGAKLHTMYFGENFDDVNNASGGIPQESTTYTTGPLKAFETYYWRVDEFDGYATYKGDIWSFTTRF